jgi:NAD(P)H-flavin reductase
VIAFHPVAVAGRRPAATDLSLVQLDLPGELADSYGVPGQYVQVRVSGHAHPGYFALSSPPGAPWELLLRSGGAIADALVAGGRAEASAAQGRGFDLARLDGRRVLLFATGSGIAPIRALIEHHRLPGSLLLYGVRHPDRLAYADRFPAWRARGVEVVPVISRPEGTGWTGRTGWVQHVLAEHSPDLADTVAVAVGVKGMIEAVRAIYAEKGLGDRVITNA